VFSRHALTFNFGIFCVQSLLETGLFRTLLGVGGSKGRGWQSSDELSGAVVEEQGDQIGRIFAYWTVVYF
jgi:hypothetical protein